MTFLADSVSSRLAIVVTPEMCAGCEVTPGKYFQAISYFFKCFSILTSSLYRLIIPHKKINIQNKLCSHSCGDDGSGLESGSIPFCRPPKLINFVHESVTTFPLFLFICFITKETWSNKAFWHTKSSLVRGVWDSSRIILDNPPHRELIV